MAKQQKIRHLLVDGYNIIHAWPNLKRLLHSNLEASRSQLCESLRAIHDNQVIRLTIVFDGKGATTEVERPTNETSFSIVFAPKTLTADTLIEQLVFNSKPDQETLVATGDNALAQNVSTNGASVITPESLLDWVNACKNQQIRNIDEHKKQADKQWKRPKF